MLEPQDDEPQFQPLTVLLRNICQDYPAGGGILRELLQNADDAGASSVRFVLDQTAYPTDDLLHPELAQYQGPALLAYNSGLFSKKDFESLSRIGDSLKRDDESTTGRFGLGFNSVYNWTDSPSIVSGNRLKILDPHKRFSNGGPSWNFVSAGGSEGIQMKNQMAVFSKVIDALDQPFNGTVIRIPLRNQSQAPRSEIRKRAVAISEVADVMRQFLTEFRTAGLLFMKNVETIIISLDNEEQIEVRILNIPEVREQKGVVNSSIKELCKKNLSVCNLSFEVSIETKWPSLVETTKFCVHHLIGQYPENEELKNWSISHSFLPWVAVATQLSLKTEDAFKGSLFTVLPLPIKTNQPVHIHGCFSLSSDRTRLIWSSDSTVQDRLPARWNGWLLDELVSTAWVELLLFLSKQYPNQPAYGTWPRLLQDSGCCDLMTNVVEIIEKQNLALWYTGNGYVKSKDALFSSRHETPDQLSAIASVGIAVIQLPDDLQDTLAGPCQALPLDTRNLCDRLNNDQIESAAEVTKLILLEYILSGTSRYSGYGALPLFPFEDGLFKSVENAAFIHRDEKEKTIFSRARGCNIDLDKIYPLSKATLMYNLSGVSSLYPSLQHRSSRHFKEYCLDTIFEDFDINEDIIKLDKDSQEFVYKAWKWILARGFSLDEFVSCVWLMPLSDGTYRKIRPQDTPVYTVCTPSGPIGNFLSRIAAIDTDLSRPIMQIDAIPQKAIELIVAAAEKDSGLYIRTGNTFEGLALWLSDIQEVVESMPDAEKIQVQELLSQFPENSVGVVAENALRELAIFQKIAWKDNDINRTPNLTWTSLVDNLKNGTRVVGLLETIPVPDLPGTCFLNSRSEAVAALLRKLDIECMSTLQVLAQFMIPFWERHLIDNWSSTCKQWIAELLLKNYTYLESDYGSRIKSLSFIPVRVAEDQSTTEFSTAAELIHPSRGELMALFYDSEEVWPAEALILKYEGVLIQLGLKIDLDNDLVKRRVSRFGERSHSLEATWTRACSLLQLNSSWAAHANQDGLLVLQQSPWLPATGIDGKMILTRADNCRSFDEELLVGYVLPVLGCPISKDWEKLFGWNELIPISVLLSQLRNAITKKDRKVVDAIFTHVATNEQIDAFSELLTDLPCVLASTGDFVLAEKSFSTGCSRLGPYLYNVDRNFWEEHKSLLEIIGVSCEPTLQNLLQIQERFELDVPVKKDMEVLIEVINRASTHPRSELSSLKILNSASSLSAIDDVVYNDGSDNSYLLASTGNFVLTHPDLPLATIRRLEIELLSERVVRKEYSEAAIDDEDEFYQHEDVITGISDTLDRYRIESTFKEYLSNAEDTGKARQVNWLLDERQHPRKSLLTQELRASQGPALLVHNDGVFKEKDFKGFKEVGRGSKRDDSTTIGKFGRGSQTMYHWTDVPMLLSGKYLLILDPLQEVLLKRNPKGPRIPGLKRPLSWFRKSFPDQLAPFDGLWGFSRDMDEYRGTIFRFPLRSRNSESRMRCNLEPLDCRATLSYMDKFYDEARISLLFLKNICQIDFTVYGEQWPRWSIKSSRESADHSFSDMVICTVTKRQSLTLYATAEDCWWVGTKDLDDNFADGLHYRHTMTMKKIQCAVAGLVSTKTSDPRVISNQVSDPKFFSYLPLPFLSNLPVNIHATFLLTGDRQSIPIEMSMRNEGADFNEQLLSSAIPILYLAFLEDLAGKIGPNVFRFWPQSSSATNTPESLICISFWDKFLTEQKSPNQLYKIFPLVSRDSQIETNQPYLLIDAKEAIFDLLPDAQSQILAGLLKSTIPTLVRIPDHIGSINGLNAVSITIRIEVQLQGLKVTSVTPQMLRSLLKSNKAAEYLEIPTLFNHELQECLFNLVKPDADEQVFSELDGCRILPLANGGLGMLESFDTWTSPELAHIYFVATDSEIELFEFASDSLIRQEPGSAFKNEMIDRGTVNLSRLGLDNVDVFLKRKDFGSSVPTKETDAWLRTFWTMWRGTESGENFPLTIKSYPIFEATRDGTRRYEQLDFESLPAVVEPADITHQALCDRIPGICRFNPTLMPAFISHKESSFNDPSSFTHFIQALNRLARCRGKRLESFIKSHFPQKDLETLRDLTINWLSQKILSEHPDIIGLLKLLPLFPSIDPSKSFISAKDSYRAEDERLLVPWMESYGRFIDPAFFLRSKEYQVLKELTVPKLTKEILLISWLLPSLPVELNVDSRKSFVSLIDGIMDIQDWRKHLSASKMYKLAPDGELQLRKTSSLFDHEDRVFASAFRLEERKRFLLTDVRPKRYFWLEIGLTHRADGNFKAQDYILCLKTIGQRLKPVQNHLDDLAVAPDLMDDAEAVLEPLIHGFYAISQFLQSDWAIVREQALFPALRDLDQQPVYRREAMTMQAVMMPLIPLAKAINYTHIPVCWSQTAFPRYEPSSLTFEKVPGHGSPSTEIVWNHLLTLSELSKNLTDNAVVAMFLSDLMRTYEYLQDNISKSPKTFTCREKKIWLNLDTIEPDKVSLQDLQSSWLSIEHLLLRGSYDSPPYMFVRDSLSTYQKLLRALDCPEIKYDVFGLPDIPQDASKLSSLAQFRREGKMIDAILSTEGKQINAHQLVLATSSPFFKSKFSGRWPSEVPVDMENIPYAALSTVVDFCYTDSLDLTHMQVYQHEEKDTEIIADKLDRLLDLCEAANFLLIDTLAAQAEHQILKQFQVFIRLENVRGVGDRAGLINAKTLKRCCELFEESNKNTVDLVYSGKESS